MARVDDIVIAKRAEDRPAWSAGDVLRSVFWAVAPWSPFIALMIIWEVVADLGLTTPYSLPSLSSIFERIIADAQSGALLLNAAVTLWRSFIGFVGAGVIGVLIGVLMARTRFGNWFFDPVVSVGFPMPKIAFLPIFILWFGFYDFSKVTMIIFNTVFPVITATLVGIAGVERELIWSARNLGTTDRRLLWDVLLPASLPAILTGLQVALPIALILDIITEMAMGGSGIGAAMQQASRFADSRGVFAGIIEIAIIGYAMVKGIAILRRRLLIWHPEAVETTTV